MNIHLSCGHVAEDGCFGVDVSWEGEDCVAGEGFVPATFYASYCHKCAMDLAKTEERAAIVEWLRETADIFAQEIFASKKRDTSEYLHHQQACTRAADAIENGDHLL